MSINVLVVDDDDDVREVMALILQDEGFLVTTAANGREALERLEHVPEPRVMLLDLMMPVMSGWETIQALRDRGLLERLRIVVCTSAPGEAPKGFPVVAKPIQFGALVSAIAAAR